VYGSNSTHPNFDGWTANQLASQPDAPQSATIDLAGGSYQYYLIWFTRLPAAQDGDYQDGIAEATLRS
jgi:putative peptidoglycan lipid II flippase